MKIFFCGKKKKCKKPRKKMERDRLSLRMNEGRAASVLREVASSLASLQSLTRHSIYVYTT